MGKQVPLRETAKKDKFSLVILTVSVQLPINLINQTLYCPTNGQKL